ncbi:hypothetical protein MTO96_017524 [Rhipicephalus appendiculatus]
MAISSVDCPSPKAFADTVQLACTWYKVSTLKLLLTQEVLSDVPAFTKLSKCLRSAFSLSELALIGCNQPDLEPTLKSPDPPHSVILDVIALNTSLRSLRLSGIRLGEDNLWFLVDQIIATSTLSEISFASWDPAEDDVFLRVLVDLFYENNSVTKLRVGASTKGVDDERWFFVEDVISRNTGLLTCAAHFRLGDQSPRSEAAFTALRKAPALWNKFAVYQQYDYVSLQEDDKKEKLGASGWMTVTTIIMGVLVLMGVVLGAVVVTGNIEGSLGTTAEDELRNLDLPLSVYVYKPATTTKSTAAPAVTTTSPFVTTTTAPSTSTEPPTTKYIPKEVGRQPLVCIMGERLTSAQQFPPDEVCDYIFYDSLYKEGNHNLLPDQTTYTESLNTFLNHHGSYRQTTLGIGFAFEFLATAEEDLKVGNPSPLEPLWRRGIFHAGILDTPTQPTRYHTRSAIETLKTINWLLDIQRNLGETAITAIAIPHPEIAWAVSFAEDFSDVRFTPHLLISFGHYRLGDDKRSICSIVPQTRHPDDVPPQDTLRDYSFDVSTPMYQLRYLYSNITDIKGAVSVTLKGRWAHPVSSENVSFYDACWSEAIPFGSYTEVCPGGGGFVVQLNYSTEHHATITYLTSIDRTFTYDNERAFAEKLCRVKALGTDVPFGIAVYDVDYDDSDNKCGYLNLFGAHSRLKALRKLVDYFKKKTAPFDENACGISVTG